MGFTGFWGLGWRLVWEKVVGAVVEGSGGFKVGLFRTERCWLGLGILWFRVR